jgi:hypothetical protein
MNKLIFKERTQDMIIQIDRSKPFDPRLLWGGKWKIREQDERSLSVAELDLSKVKLVSTLEMFESEITDRTNHERLIGMPCIPLDIQVLHTLTVNPAIASAVIPNSWKCPPHIEGTWFIYFNGTVLEAESGSSYIAYICWSKGRFNYAWTSHYQLFDVGNGFGRDCFSAVLEP